MKKLLRSSLLLLLFSGAASAAQAQAVLVNGLATLFRVGVTAAHGDYGDKTVTTATYRDQEFPVKRTPAEQLTGEAADQIGLLEAQLEQCHQALAASATGPVCPASQLATIKAAQAVIAAARPNWSQKFYKRELAFYQAEDARRLLAAGQAAPTPDAAPK
ncbi:hypothetical protein [uncultured Hymenobacter sp.]|uniref:hypothetical protein n=1 Tax=uncultured Hymenobacter sp. TaxID=170016 RepID=UPI0035CB8C42